MKVLICEQPGELSYGEKPVPDLAEGYSLIKIRRIGVCGTDLHAFEGTQPYFNYPRILGHELSGELLEPNGAKGFTKGDRVTFIPYFNCGVCIACKAGKPNCCVKINVFGVHIDGGMAEYVTVPSQSLVHSEGLSFDELALVEPLAIGAHGVNRARVQAGEYVLVIGAGPIGLGVIEFARIAGGKVIAMDINAERLEFCRTHLKVDHIINVAEGDVIQQLNAITGNNMAEVVIDATGNQNAINNGFQYMAHGGRYVLVGLQKGEIKFSHPEFHKREATLMSSRNATRADFEQVVLAIKEKLIDPNHYITHRVQFDDVKQDFEGWLNPANGVIKAMIAL
ncbi:zinc-binding alcohol dehydrogenase family protein [Mucilaginibacter sp. SP1R1]|uniref:zinc-binding alcohol dehydrogenase family protein n=1 Tax=Mucilaginibacter sp. SP1R1 TaxID=2723091 RepID=UPI00161D959F|nr:zinc-binding alcohol dehydrogenase family protein [Mucilaginibacter sp. SP1R1]MBB6148903.1 2-desacetyl-2-hydroxyethyl bacteriochlorophyllide A dehydrogenase [Mucilaginibacter sp. SP1R1]